MVTFLQNYLAKTSKEKHSSAVISFLSGLDALNVNNPFIVKHIVQELQDQRSSLKLIASENYSSLEVQLAMGNLLTDKYAEGYPFHRFYAGCENVDALEDEACRLAKEIFQAEHAYVQPHSGADANLVAFFAILTSRVQSKEVEKLGKKTIDELAPEEFEMVRQALCNQKVLGLSLSSGGHLTHGYRHNVSAKMMKASSYDVDPKTGRLNYDAISEIAKREKPTILLAGFSAYPRNINFAKMREIADSVGAVLMVDMAHFAGLVAGGVFQGDENPIPFAHIATSTTHKTLRGPRGGLVLCKEEFKESVNKGCPLILGGPLPHVIAAKAVAFKEASLASFKTYAAKIVENAKALGQELMRNGLRLTTEGTDNHLMIIDVSPLGLTGRHAEIALRESGITANRNMIPFDTQGPWYTSGLRFGTPALTTLGMGKDEMRQVGSLIAKILKATKPLPQEGGGFSKAKAKTDESVVQASRMEVKNLLSHFPLYPEICLPV